MAGGWGGRVGEWVGWTGGVGEWVGGRMRLQRSPPAKEQAEDSPSERWQGGAPDPRWPEPALWAGR